MREVIEVDSQSPSSIVALPPPPPPLLYQGHLLEGGCGSVKHKHWFDVVVEELTNPVEEDQEVGMGEGVPMCISRPLHCLVQPDTHVWYMWVRRREGGGYSYLGRMCICVMYCD